MRSLNGSEGFVVTRKFPIEDSSQLGEVRRQLTRLAQDLHFSDTGAGQVAIVVMELANNLLQHAGGGEILAREICSSADDDAYAIEIISIDRGPGMADPEACLQDGYSTRSTPGQGLGAVKRLAQEFDLYSIVGKGTVISATFQSKPEYKAHLPIRSSVVCIPMNGETHCGDAWAELNLITGPAVVVADGLGHGPLAQTASHEATATFREQNWKNPDDYIKLAHARLRSTRGAAVSTVIFDKVSGQLRYAGVGNVRALLASKGKWKTLVTYPGTVGLRLNPYREMVEDWKTDDLFVMHSDGVSSRWDFKDYPGLTNRLPAVIAGVIYRDFSRGHDDTCIWVGRAADDE